MTDNSTQQNSFEGLSQAMILASMTPFICLPFEQARLFTFITLASIFIGIDNYFESDVLNDFTDFYKFFKTDIEKTRH